MSIQLSLNRSGASYNQKTITHKIFETDCSFHVKIEHNGNSLISVFPDFAGSINK